MNKESFITRLSAEPIDEDFIQCQELLYKIEGWFSPASHALFSFILNYQNKNEIIGNLGEIGVWKGKSATVICKFSKEDEKIFLIDPLIKKFSETIYKNIDDVCKCIPKELLFCNLISDNFVKLPNYQTLIKSFRFFHIDGCHTGKNIFKDLELADLLVQSEGIVVVDDFFNNSYPQITEAVYKYLYVNPYSFRIFCIGFNKAYLCRPEYYGNYYSYFMDNLQTDFMKKRLLLCIKKTSGIGDSYTLSIEGYNKDADPITGFRGPDWEQNRLEYILKRKI